TSSAAPSSRFSTSEIARARARVSPAFTPAASSSSGQSRRAIGPLYATAESGSASRRQLPNAVGSSAMLGQLTAQFSIVGMREHAGFRKLLLARLVSALGTWTAFCAVRIALYEQTGSAWWVSILLFCELVPGVILGIAVGPLINRWNRKRMMVFSDLGGAACFAAPPRDR